MHGYYPAPVKAPRAVVAIVGGATAGAEAAGLLAERGIPAVVFEQNPRPFGKIEDGFDYADHDPGRLAGYDAAFGAGNVVTGKGDVDLA